VVRGEAYGINSMFSVIDKLRPVEQRLGDDEITNVLPNDQSGLQLAEGWLKEEKISWKIIMCLRAG
jgi:hypothetical protein